MEYTGFSSYRLGICQRRGVSHNSGGTGKLTAPESTTKGTETLDHDEQGTNKNSTPGTPHLRDERSRITGNTSKDERISADDAW